MKITFSTSSFDANLCNPHNATTMSCFSSILRRFLCFDSLRTHPFDCVKEAVPKVVEDDDPNDVKIEGLGAPGIVARLMGLDTMPELDSVSSKRTKDSIRRSRSVNSAGYWSEFDHTDAEHRRVKSSSSFREIPSFFNQEDDEFLVLSFEDVKGKKPRKGCKELKQNSRVEPIIAIKSCNADISSRRSRVVGINREEIKHSTTVSCHNKDDIRSHTFINPKSHLEARNNKEEFRKDLCGALEVEGGRSSENSSPVSVLDLVEFTSEPESVLSEEDQRLKGSNSRRKLSTELANPDRQSSNLTEISITQEEPNSIGPQVSKSTQELNSHGEDHSEACEDVCKLAEAEMKTSNWITREISKMGDFEEIGFEIGLRILDHLLYEIVIELL